MRGKKLGEKIKCQRCGSYDIIPLVNMGREDSMCQKCGFVIENEQRMGKR